MRHTLKQELLALMQINKNTHRPMLMPGGHYIKTNDGICAAVDECYSMEGCVYLHA